MRTCTAEYYGWFITYESPISTLIKYLIFYFNQNPLPTLTEMHVGDRDKHCEIKPRTPLYNKDSIYLWKVSTVFETAQSKLQGMCFSIAVSMETERRLGQRKPSRANKYDVFSYTTSRLIFHQEIYAQRIDLLSFKIKTSPGFI